MASSTKNQLKEWDTFLKQTEKFSDNVIKVKARRFKGKLDKLLNFIFTLIADAIVIAIGYLDIGGFNINDSVKGLFTGNGIFDSFGGWAVIAAVLGVSTGLSRGSVKLPKFLKKITVRPGLVASVAVLAALPVAVENKAITYTNMILIAFGFIFYSCFASRSNLRNLSLRKSEINIASQLDNLQGNIITTFSDDTKRTDLKNRFVKLSKKISGSNRAASRSADRVIFVMAIIITGAWIFCIRNFDVTLVSAAAVLALTTVVEWREAYKGPSTVTNEVDETLSEDNVNFIYNQVKCLVSPVG